MTSGGMDDEDAGYNPAEWTTKMPDIIREMDIRRGRNTGENRIYRKRKTENPPLYRKEEAVFASSFLFIAIMSRL